MTDWEEKIKAVIGGTIVFIIFVVVETSVHPIYASEISQIPSVSFQSLLWTIITLGSIITAVGILSKILKDVN